MLKSDRVVPLPRSICPECGEDLMDGIILANRIRITNYSECGRCGEKIKYGQKKSEVIIAGECHVSDGALHAQCHKCGWESPSFSIKTTVQCTKCSASYRI